MHTSHSNKKKSLCKTCSKSPSIFFCQGCHKDFCNDHAKEHRQELSKQLDNIIQEHDNLQQNLFESMDKSRTYPFMKDIDQWETESIEKIRQIADDIRAKVLDIVDNRTVRITKGLKNLTKDLTKARFENNFIEYDLKDWMDKLNKWNKYLNSMPSISIVQDEKDTISIQKININMERNEFFHRVAGNIKIEEHGQVIIANSNDLSTVRCVGEYSSGQHKFRFKIEQFSTNNWICFGIVSKDAPIQETSYLVLTSFGWIANGWILLDGTSQPGDNKIKSDIIQDDIVELFVDCDQRILRLINERTKIQQQLDINIETCPFPWQLHVGLRYQNDRVRYLKS
ncbi:unnamed protein product [Adineta steineri]|uniref:B box-type domain-containing protein n=1 Tax=Adineta steineri TaxID=433720 RepID=A0A813QYU8_9BILA|nr:unnamed protein product [Adineta steineri]CAF0772995.1 unnamed protein product [Adineta steineri]CAF3818439.1 unnamed protein product [Adineta steineri]CAF4012166.1 unnamed protein product [Adineta steineri]